MTDDPYEETMRQLSEKFNDTTHALILDMVAIIDDIGDAYAAAAGKAKSEGDLFVQEYARGGAAGCRQIASMFRVAVIHQREAA